MSEAIAQQLLYYTRAANDGSPLASDLSNVLLQMLHGRGAGPTVLNDLATALGKRNGSAAGALKVAEGLKRWADALNVEAWAAVSDHGNALLRELSAQGVSNEVLANLQGTLGTHLMQAQKAHATQGCGVGADGDGAEGAIDWYDPDPDQFYVLDAQSGQQLARALAKLKPEAYAALVKRECPVPTRMLFLGPPGTGKTTGARWLANQLGMTVALIRIDGVVGAKVGETARRLRAAFAEATKRQALIVIDELAAVAVPQDDASGNVGQWNRETTLALLQLIDALPPEQIFIGCTNTAERIDSAVRRRTKNHIHFGMPDRPAREAMLKRWWRAAPYTENAWLRLIEGGEGYSGDFLQRVSEEANSTAALRGEDEKINAKDVKNALEEATATEKVIAAKFLPPGVPVEAVLSKATEVVTSKGLRDPSQGPKQEDAPAGA